MTHRPCTSLVSSLQTHTVGSVRFSDRWWWPQKVCSSMHCFLSTHTSFRWTVGGRECWGIYLVYSRLMGLSYVGGSIRALVRVPPGESHPGRIEVSVGCREQLLMLLRQRLVDPGWWCARRHFSVLPFSAGRDNWEARLDFFAKTGYG